MDLDDELRRLFQDQRLDIPVKPGADDAVVTGARRVRRRRRALASAGSAFAVAALVAGGVALAGLGGPTSMPPAGPAPSTVTKTVSVEPSTPVSGSVGYGVLKLGMAEADAVSTGFLTRGPDDSLGCHTYFTQGHPDAVGAVVISPTAGVVRITLPDDAKTSMGISVGASVADLKARYPKAVEHDFGFTVTANGTPSWVYVFLVESEAVTRIRMQLDTRECFLT